jgi:hypothetical protein
MHVKLSGHDDRLGLGYGQHRNNFHKTRNANATFPYVDTDANRPGDDLKFDPEEIDRFVSKINGLYYPSDSLAHKGTNPFYFAAGNTKLGEVTLSNSISPMPHIYKKRNKSSMGTMKSASSHGGPTHGFRSNSRPTGTKKGFSSAPHPHMEDTVDNEIYSLKDIEELEPYEKVKVVQYRLSRMLEDL